MSTPATPVVAEGGTRKHGGWVTVGVSADEHPSGPCSSCSLHWGHSGQCLYDFNSEPHARTRVCQRSWSSPTQGRRKKSPKFDVGQTVWHRFEDAGWFSGEVLKRRAGVYVVEFSDGEVWKDMREEELELERLDGTTDDGDNDGVEDEVDEVDVELVTEEEEVEEEVLASTFVTPPPPTSPYVPGTFPSISSFMRMCRLEAHTQAMKDAGWDDVAFLSLKVREMFDFEVLEDFPISKVGHREKLLYFLQKLEQEGARAQNVK